MKVYIIVTTFGMYGEVDDVRAYSDKQKADDFVATINQNNIDNEFFCFIYERELG